MQHGFLQFGLAHLPVADADAGAGNQFLDHGGARPDGIHAVVQEIDLAAAAQLQFQRRADQFGLERGHHGVDGQPVLGRRFDHRHVPQPQ